MQFRDYVPITAETLRQAFQLKRYKNVRREERGGGEGVRERDVGGRECVCACARERQRARVCDALDLRPSFTAVCVQVIIPVGWGGYNQRQCFHVFTDFMTI